MLLDLFLKRPPFGTILILVTTSCNQCAKKVERAKKVVSDSPGLVDFAIGLDNSVFNLPDGQVMFFEEFK